MENIMVKEKDIKALELKGVVQKNGNVLINTSKWMRPKTACEIFKKAGIRISKSNMNYWINQDKIESIKIKELDDLTLVNIESAPEEVQRYIK